MSVPLRKWQLECTAKTLHVFKHGQTNFLCVAAPGAGKTRYSANVAAELFELDEIDFFSNINDIIILVSFIILFGIFTSYISSYFMTQKYLKLKISR